MNAYVGMYKYMLSIFRIVGFCSLFILWDFVLCDFILWDFLPDLLGCGLSHAGHTAY